MYNSTGEDWSEAVDSSPKKGKCETPKMLFLRKFAQRFPLDFALLGIVGPSLHQMPQ